MKIILNVLCMLFLASGQLSAQGMNFEKGDWAVITAKALKEHKYIFIDLYTSWCGPCKELEKNVFPNDTAGRFMNSRFINTHYDAEKGFGKVIAKKFAPVAYPTFIILNEDGRLINRGFGGWNVSGFIQYMQLLIAGGPMSFATGITDRMDLSYPDFYNDFFERQKRPDKDVVTKYMRSQKDWLTEINWNILSLYGNYLPEYKEWAYKHAAEIKDLFKVAIDTDPIPLVMERIQKAIQEKDIKLFEGGIKQLEGINATSANPAIAMKIRVSKLEFYSQTGDWDKFFLYIKGMEPTPGMNWVHAAIRMLIEHTTDSVLLVKGLLLLRDTVLTDNADRARLLLVMKRNQEASNVVDTLINNKQDEQVKENLIELANYMLQQAVIQKEEYILQKAISILNKIQIPDLKLTGVRFKISFYDGTRQWDKMCAWVDSLINLDMKVDAREIAAYAIDILDHCNGHAQLEEAIEWMAFNIKRAGESRHAFQYTYARLLYKDHQHKKAIENLRQILRESKGKVENTDEAKLLLKKIEREDNHSL